jgi:signal transduction histidine kinase
MGDRFLLKLVVPLIAISCLLFGLGAVAAWNVQRQQAVTSTLIAREVEGMLAAHNVYVGMREIRHQLNQYLRTRQQEHSEVVRRLHEETEAQLERAKSLSRTAEERDLIGVVDRGYRQFWDEFQRITSEPGSAEHEAEMERLIDTTLTETILIPGQKYIEYSHGVVERTNEASRATSNQMRQGFLFLGVCGGAAGMVAGLGIARAVSRSIVQLEVSVRSAAGKLNQVAGPVMISQVGGLRDLETGLHTMESHIGDVVERLQRSEMEVLRNEQLAAVGQLAAGIAHELRNPLMPMKMLVQAALDRGDDKGLSGRQLEVVEQEIGRLEQAIQSFLDFAKPVPPEKTTFDLVHSVEQSLELVAGRAEQQAVYVREQLPETPVLVEADAAQIRQVLLNLLLNALDALPYGGEIVVSVEGPSRVHAPNGGPEWTTIRIADSGVGVPEEILGRVFEPFVTTKETGTGLGLPICRRIVTEHGGEIACVNRPEGGAEFIIRLPSRAARLAAEPVISGGP